MWSASMTARVMLSLDCAGEDSADELTLEHEAEHDDRPRDEDRGRRQQVDLHEVAAGDGAEAEGDRLVGRAAEEDQRRAGAIPGPQEPHPHPRAPPGPGRR